MPWGNQSLIAPVWLHVQSVVVTTQSVCRLLCGLLVAASGDGWRRQGRYGAAWQVLVGTRALAMRAWSRLCLGASVHLTASVGVRVCVPGLLAQVWMSTGSVVAAHLHDR